MGEWLRVLDTIGGLVQMSSRIRRPPDGDLPREVSGAGGPLGQLETRLAGVVVAALKEAFDRDRARMDMERSQGEAERRQAEAAFRAELRRQAAERALGQLRLLAVTAAAVWMLSAALSVWLPNMRTPVPLMLMATGWACAIGALGAALHGWQHVAVGSGYSGAGLHRPVPGGGVGEAVAELESEAPLRQGLATAALWLLLASLALTGGSLLSAL